MSIRIRVENRLYCSQTIRLVANELTEYKNREQYQKIRINGFLDSSVDF